MNGAETMNFAALLDLYRGSLLDDVVPYWLRHGIDENGGVNTCMNDDGTLVSRDRWNWSQWRAVWVFSKLYNVIQPKQEWLETAKGIYDFVTKYGPDEGGHWPLLLDGDGNLKRGYESLYVDGFAIYGLAELYRATGDGQALDHALKTFEACERAFSQSEPPPAWPYPIPPGRMAHGMSMLFSLAYHELSLVSGQGDVEEAGLGHHQRVMNDFLRSDRGHLLEWLQTDRSEVPAPEGTAVVPGHAIESMWFQIHIAQKRKDDETIKKATEAIRFHLEKGWDEEFGGIFLAIDAHGRKEVSWPHAETKLWWPHTEALYATLLAYEHCREDWALDWHERICSYTYDHFPSKEHGEWRQKLDRRGKAINETLFLPVKDPFHLPRALIYLIEVLERLPERKVPC